MAAPERPDDTLQDASAPELTQAVTRGLTRALRQLGQSVLTEVALRNGRRADVMALDRAGHFTIYEVKVTTADFLGDGKWPDYADYCDRLYFAVPLSFPLDLLPEDCGVMVADAYGAEEIRPAPDEPLHASRRKALTLQFARTAAERLCQMRQEGEEEG
ncbi:MAG: MmcB family DNA repair protein [Alphaproteobacteria bacterium]|nr:MmcB family DNA repair protein [Alphaproteobacteria bacterium]